MELPAASQSVPDDGSRRMVTDPAFLGTSFGSTRGALCDTDRCASAGRVTPNRCVRDQRGVDTSQARNGSSGLSHSAPSRPCRCRYTRGGPPSTKMFESRLANGGRYWQRRGRNDSIWSSPIRRGAAIGLPSPSGSSPASSGASSSWGGRSRSPHGRQLETPYVRLTWDTCCSPLSLGGENRIT
jgi:hypothetical protein